MKLTKALFVLSTALIAGCSAVNEKIVTSGNQPVMRHGYHDLKNRLANGEKITKEKARRAGFDCETQNAQCFQGADAMRFVLGTDKNDPRAANSKDLDEYVQAIKVYEAWVFPHKKVKTEKSRWFFSSRKSPTKGTEAVYILIFKEEALFDMRFAERKINELEKESSFGGNVLEAIIGAGFSAGKKFW